MASTISRARRMAAAASVLLLSLTLTGCSDSTGRSGAQGGGAEASEQATAEESGETTASSSQSKKAGARGDSAGTDKAAATVAAMSLEEKVAQLFFVTPESLTGVGQVVAAGDSTKTAYEKTPVGGLIYFDQNMLDTDQAAKMLGDMQKIATKATGLPAFLAVDEEGGQVVRVGGRSGFQAPNLGDMRAIGDAGDTDKAREAAKEIGSYLVDLGFNVDFAPVADIANTSSTTMSRRAFGSTEEAVSPMVEAQVKGFADAGILSCVKHFPGIGGAHGDSHDDAIATTETVEDMKAEELEPFEAAMEADVPFVMVGHLTVKEATGSDLPASLNPKIMTDLLREDLGYDGIIITDSLSMGAVTKFYDEDEVGLQALLAGADMILMPLDFEGSYKRVLGAVKSGEISEDRIDESVTRVVRAKLAL